MSPHPPLIRAALADPTRASAGPDLARPAKSMQGSLGAHPGARDAAQVRGLGLQARRPAESTQACSKSTKASREPTMVRRLPTRQFQLGSNYSRVAHRKPSFPPAISFSVRRYQQEATKTSNAYELMKVNFDNRSSQYELSKVLGLIGKILTYYLVLLIHNTFIIMLSMQLVLQNKLLEIKSK